VSTEVRSSGGSGPLALADQLAQTKADLDAAHGQLAEAQKAVELETQARQADAAGDFDKAEKLRQAAATAKGFEQVARQKAEDLRKNPPPSVAQQRGHLVEVVDAHARRRIARPQRRPGSSPRTAQVGRQASHRFRRHGRRHSVLIVCGCLLRFAVCRGIHQKCT
jgi:hypothetical protein